MMVRDKEYQCITAGRQARVASAQRRLDDLYDNGKPFDNPLGGVSWDLDEDGAARNKIKKILLLPVAVLLIAFSTLLVVPIAYLAHRWDIYKQKQTLKREVADEKTRPSDTELPALKTLDALWQLHGLLESKYSSDERLDLLSQWLEILYGTDVAEDLAIKHRVDAIGARHLKANRSYHEYQYGAAHFNFAAAVESLIRQLSDELFEYDVS